MADNIKNNKEIANETNGTAPTHKYEIPFEGSLGLLAMGAVGLKAWRNKRNEILNAKLNKDKSE